MLPAIPSLTHLANTGQHRSSYLIVSFFLVLIGVCAAYSIWHRDTVVVPEIEKRFGFAADTKYVPNNSLPQEVLYIDEIKSGGEFEKFGFLPKDVILSHGRASFFETLSTIQSGEKVKITVGRGAPFSKLDSLEAKIITISYPDE